MQLFWAMASGTSQRSLRQAVCDPAFQGRMQSASTTLTAGARPLAAATAGGLVLLLDVRATLAIGALVHVRGHESTAAERFLRAEMIDPQRVHADALIGNSVSYLLGKRLPAHVRRDLAGLAHRMGMSR